MTDEPENLTLKLLREMRSEMREGFEKAFGDLTELRGSVSELRGSVSDLQVSVAAMRADQGRANELLEQVHEVQKNQGARLNVIDGRLAIIEKHIGLVEA
jgi:predicted nuclease with TOPRIM domain